MSASKHGVLKPGDSAPDFSLTDQNGNTVKLSDYRGKKTVVIAFYIKAFTGGCTKELSTYQERIEQFDGSGVQVIGISVDRPGKNKAYASSLGLGYPVLSDEHREVARLYGVLMPVIRLAKRVTFVVDRKGVIQSIQRGGEALDPANSLAASAALGLSRES